MNMLIKITYRFQNFKIIFMKNKMKKTKKLILQVGESTHTHVLNSKKSIDFEHKGDDIFQFLLKDTGVVTHEEHDRINLEKGTYFKFPQIEFDPLANDIRQVFD